MKKKQLLNNVMIYLSLLMFSTLIIYLPFSANDQVVNFVSLRNNDLVTDAAKNAGFWDTIIFYPLIAISVIAAFIITIMRIKGKDQKFNSKRWLMYICLLISISTFFAQYSKIVYIPYLVVFVCLFFEKRLEELNAKIPQKIKKITSKVANWINPKIKWSYPYVALLSIFTINNLFIFKANNNWPTMVIAQKPLYWVSILLELLIFWLLHVISQRYWGPATFTVAFYNFFYLFSVVMRKVRNDAIVPSQLKMLKGATKLSGMISPIILVALAVVIISMFSLSHLMHEIYPVPKSKWYTRILGVILFIGAFGSSFFWNRPTTPVADFMSNKLWDNRQFFNQSYGAEINGPLVQFLNNVDIQTMIEPKGYSKATMQQVAKRYQKLSHQLNKERTNQIDQFTVIYNLSESFADPKRVPTVSYQGDPIPTIHQQTKQNGGIMMSSGYGGGTANMEYMTLTSMPTTNYQATLATPYTQLVPYHEHTYSIADQFKHTTAIHPYNTMFYDRSTDYPKLGIHTFYNIDDKKHPIKHQHLIEDNPYLSDQTAYDNVIDQLQRCQDPQFINLVTMQNHTPWDNKYQNTEKWNATAGDGTDEDVLSQYIQGINYTDKAVQKFIDKIKDRPQPIVWVFYGDHLPGLYTNPMDQDGLILHQTDYFIYLNNAAKKKIAGQSKKMATKFVDPNEFTAQVLQLTNSQVTPFEALQIQTMNHLPTKVTHTTVNQTNQYAGNLQWINSETGRVINHPHFNRYQKQLWHDYKLIQYDQSAGKNYLPKDFFKK